MPSARTGLWYYLSSPQLPQWQFSISNARPVAAMSSAYLVMLVAAPQPSNLTASLRSHGTPQRR